MADISVLGRLHNGAMRNVDLTDASNSLVVHSIKLGTVGTNTELSKVILDGLIAHAASTSNPHSVTATQVGLGNVDNVQQLPMSYLDTDNTLAADSDAKVASQKAVKAYVDGHAGAAASALDGTFVIKNTADNTKRIAFDASNIATSSISTIAVPDGNVDLGALTDSNISTTAAIVESKLSLDYSTSSLNTAIGGKVAKAGDTMSGNLAMGGNKVTGLGAPSVNGDALRYDQLGANNGIATLDGGGKIPVGQLPNSVMTYEGTFDASATPAAPLLNGDSAANAGMVYLASVAGSYDFGAGAISFALGDWAVYNGSIWEKSLNSNAVVSVNGQTGVVSLTKSDVGLGNVDNTSDATKNSATATLTNKTIDAASNTISNISNAEISASAAIAYSKLALTDSIVDADINSAAAIAYSKLNLAASVTEFDLAADVTDGVTLAGGNGTKLSVSQAPSLVTVNVANEALAGSSFWAVRYAVAADSGFVAGRMSKATNDASSADLFYVTGLVRATGAISAGGSINVIRHGTISGITHGFTVGQPVYLGADGVLTGTAPSATNTAVVRVGMAVTATTIWVDIAVVGIN